MLVAVVVAAAAWSAVVHAGPCWNLTHPECWFSGRALLHGPPSQLGDFHGCLDRVRQQYCLLTLRLSPAGEPPEQPPILWDTIQEASSRRTRFRRHVVDRGVCVPAGLKNEQVAEGVQAALEEAAGTEGLNVSVEADDDACQTGDRELFPWDTPDLIALGVAIFLIFLVAVATTTEGFMRLKNATAQSKALRALVCFSMISNWRRLRQPPRKHANLRFVQGARFLTMTIIIFGHHVILMEAGPILNPEFIEKSYGRLEWTTIFNGHLVVSTYFVISGFLLSYLFLHEVASRKKFHLSYIWWAFFYRYLRLTPTYAAVLVASVNLAPHTGHGPMWKRLLGWDRRACRSHWWANMLYINNYVYADDTCLLHTWYLAADTQLFLVFLVVLVAVWRWPRRAPHILAACAALSCLVPALVAYFLQLQPTLLSLPETLRRVSYDHTFLHSYVPAHMNASPYVAGVITGYALYRRDVDMQGKPLSKWAGVVVWVVSLSLSMGTLLSPFPFYQDGWLDNPSVTAAYQAFFRLAYGGGIGVAFYGCALGVGWIADYALSWGPFQSLGRIAYSAYLVHYTLQKTSFGMQFHEEYVSEARVVTHWFSDVVVAFLSALILCLLVELPTSALCSLLLPSGKKKEDQESTPWKSDALNGTKVCKDSNGISHAPSVDLNLSATTLCASTNGSATTLSTDGKAPAGKHAVASGRPPLANKNGWSTSQTNGTHADMNEIVTTPSSEIYGASVWRAMGTDAPETPVETCHL